MINRKTTVYLEQNDLPLGYQNLDVWPDGYYNMLEMDEDDIKSGRIRCIGLDIETNGLDPYHKNAEIISIALSGINSSFVLHKDDFKLGLKVVRKIVESSDMIVVGHNIKFDLNFLTVYFGWNINCIAYDTMLAAYFLDTKDKFLPLEELIKRYKIIPAYKTTLRHISKEDLMLRNMKDAKVCSLLKHNIFDSALFDSEQTNIMSIACQAVTVLSKVETRGIKVDMIYAKQQQMKLYKQLLDLKLSLKQLANTTFNPDSPSQLASVLYGKLEFIPTRFNLTGSASTDYESILRLKQEQFHNKSGNVREFINTLLTYTKLNTTNEKYYNKLPLWIKDDGCVHTNFNLCATNTGRLTSNNPNMQNQKRGSEFRGVYVPRPGYTMLEGDWSQIELRIAAWLAREDKMLRMFEEGLDIHTAVMCDIMKWNYDETIKLLETPGIPEYQDVKNLRVGIKNVNFGELYGASAGRLQREMVKNGIYWELNQCQNLYEQRKYLYPNLTSWKKRMERFIVKHKFVTMPFGQIRKLPNASFDTVEGRTELRQGVNFIIQSTASGWMPIIGMIVLDNYFKQYKEYDGHILLQVHDSILSEVRILNEKKMERLKKDVQKIMEKDIKELINEVFNVDITVPLEFKCDYMNRWR